MSVFFWVHSEWNGARGQTNRVNREAVLGRFVCSALQCIPHEPRKRHSFLIFTMFPSKQKRSTEGCSKFKSPDTRQVQERLVSTLEHMQVPKWDRTRSPEELASSVGMPHPLHMFYGNLAQLGKKSNSVIRSRPVMVKKILSKQKRSTEGCSKFKSPETRQVQERLVSTLEHM